MQSSYRFKDLVDLSTLETIFQHLHRLTGAPLAVVDDSGEVLVGVGWQEICLAFHRSHPEACRLCVESDLGSRKRSENGTEQAIYCCPHGLIDSCYPVVIEGAISAYVFTGQFLHKPVSGPVRERFRQQARDYGFNEEAYLAALDKVPIIPPERHQQILDLLSSLAGQIAEMGLAAVQGQRYSEQLKRNDELLRLSLAATNDGIWDWQIAGDAVHWSSGCYRMLGHDSDSFPVTIEAWRQLVHPDDRDQVANLVRSVVRDSGAFSSEYRLRRSNGEYLWVHGRGRVVEWGTDGAAVRVVGTHTDISERKEAEEKNRRLQAQLRQAQKLEAIGTLAGGIAHDFNNILGAMIGFTDMVIEDLPENSLHHSELRKVLQAGHRARDLIGQILAFSRQSDARRLTLQPQAIIKEVAKLLRSTLPTTIDIKRTIAPGCSAIDADPTQFHQILMNLCTNAYHAMEDSGGTLTISLRPASVLPETLRRQSERTNDSYLELLIADTGQGMSPAIVEKIFDPFFTTKVKEKGTGMGLSIVYGIVSEYGGAVSVESEVGIGSTFHVFWPCSPKPDITAQAKQEVVAGGTERIMLVDDEELLLEMTGKMLERCGYRVTPVTDSRRAGELFGENPDIYDLVITDQTMPGLTGMELAKQMMSVRPDLPIILCTGYSASVDEGRVKEAGLSALIFKPLLKNELLALIRSVLVGDSSEPSLCPEAV